MSRPRPEAFELRRPTMPFTIASLLCFCNALPVVWNWYAFWGGREPVIDVLELVKFQQRYEKRHGQSTYSIAVTQDSRRCLSPIHSTENHYDTGMRRWSLDAVLRFVRRWGHRRICSKAHAKRHRGTLSADPAVAGIHFGAALWAKIVAVEGDVLPAERRDVGKQIIADNLTLGTQLGHSVTEINGVQED
jgi:hypothetical protein